MKTTVIVNVHNESDHTFSSKDFNGYLDFKNESAANKFLFEKDFIADCNFKDAKSNIKLIYLPTLEYNHQREKMESIFKSGFSKNADLYWRNKEKKDNEKREKSGYVVFKDHKSMKSKDYKGNLEKSLTKYVRDYIGSSGVFGYLGHNARKFSHDTYIEKEFGKIEVYLDGEKLDKWEILGVWLTSSDARHWMDSREDETLAEFKKSFSGYVSTIAKLGYIYNLPDHEGSAASTHDLWAEYVDRITVQ